MSVLIFFLVKLLIEIRAPVFPMVIFQRSWALTVSQLCCGAAVVLLGFHLNQASHQSSQMKVSLLAMRSGLSQSSKANGLYPGQRGSNKHLSILYERQLDEGEDYYSAIQAPDKAYEWY